MKIQCRQVPKGRLDLLGSCLTVASAERSSQGLVKGDRTEISSFKPEAHELYNLHKAKIGEQGKILLTADVSDQT